MSSASSRPLTVGTAGHIDHGKTALVEALTGRNTDRLDQERERGISIELGFAPLELPDGRRLSLVDVPGHEQLVRTMISGATGIDLFLLVVAADDGVMPQTREHLAVLETLGLEHGVVALSKIDLVDELTAELAAEEIAALLPATPIIPVSAKTGDGVEVVRAALAAAADRVAEERAESPGEGGDRREAVLYVDRAFSLHGIGTVVTGTLQGGRLSTDEEVEIVSRGSSARVRSIQVHDEQRADADPGQRVALNLAGTSLSDVGRGDVIASHEARIRPSYRLDVELNLREDPPSLDGKRVQVHHGTADAPARVAVLDEVGRFAQLRLSSPLHASAGDRVVIRQIAPPDTLGGGVVVDPEPRRHGRGPAAERLRLLREGDAREVLAAAVEVAPIPPGVGSWHGHPVLGPAFGRFPAATWEQAAASLIEEGALASDAGRLIRPGDAQPAEPEPASVELTERDLEVLGLLRSDRAAPRSPQALADSVGVERTEIDPTLERLAAAGEVERVGPSMYFESEALDDVRHLVIELATGRDGSISLAELRDDMGTSRKYAQAILEHLDGDKTLVRRGERHHLRTKSGG